MPAQEVALSLSPSALLQRFAGQSQRLLLDGGGRGSWHHDEAWLALRPRATLRVYGDGRARLANGDRVEEQCGDPFDLLEQFRRRHAPATGGEITGFVALALSYDLRHFVDRVRARRHPSPDTCLLYAAAYDWVLRYSYATGVYELMTHPDLDPNALRKEVTARAAAAAPPQARQPARAAAMPELARARHLAAIGQALEQIAAGEIYQVNLAQRFTAPAPSDGARAFADLLQIHPMPFSAYLDCGDFELLSNSPECLLAIEGESIATFPIKGTRPRGHDADEDQRLVDELRGDAKECAEHVMIVDLERNDLGRICRGGSVAVDDLMRVRSYGSLHHLESRVSGRLRAEVDLAEILRASFPGGSVTGAPKLRAIEIIDELEAAERGFYTGAIGYLLGDRAVLNIAIRTATLKGGALQYWAGGGIVADSVPEREYDETLLKAQPFLAAIAGEA